MFYYADYLAELERRKDEIAQAEQYRLSLQVPRPSSPTILAAYRRLRVRLGESLVSWGHRLQARDLTATSVGACLDCR